MLGSSAALKLALALHPHLAVTHKPGGVLGVVRLHLRHGDLAGRGDCLWWALLLLQQAEQVVNVPWKGLPQGVWLSPTRSQKHMAAMMSMMCWQVKCNAAYM